MSNLTEKKCNSCEQPKNLSEFYYNKSKGYHDSQCKGCRSEKDRAKRTPEINRQSNLKRMYQMTIDEYEEMFVGQNGVCAICLSPETYQRKGESVRRLAVDHCHSTGVIRGLLCHKCNTMIGLSMEKESTLMMAIEYLRKANAGTTD